MKKIIFVLCVFCLCGACKSAPEPVEPDSTEPEEIEQPEPIVTEPEPEEQIIATFGVVTITQKDYTDAKSEIETVVEDLNKITATSNYNRWVTYLSRDYKEYLSQPALLEQVSKKLPVKGIKLKNLYDYFTYVFVPSHKNSRVDDIKFTSPTTVNVMMQEDTGLQLIIYTLEKIDNNWKLVRETK